MHSPYDWYLGFVIGCAGVLTLGLGLRKKGSRVNGAVGWFLILLALLSSIAEFRWPFFATHYWIASGFLASLFAVGYTYLFKRLTEILGIRTWGSSIRVALLPFMYLGLAVTIIVTSSAGNLENPALAFFLSLALFSAIHVLLFVAVILETVKSPRFEEVFAVKYDQKPELMRAIWACGLVIAALAVVQVKSTSRREVFFVDEAMLIVLGFLLIRFWVLCSRPVVVSQIPRQEGGSAAKGLGG